MVKTVCAEEEAQARMACLLIWGLACPNCGVLVRNTLLRVDGVVSAQVDWERGLAFVDYLPARTAPAALVRAVAGTARDGEHDFRAALLGQAE